MSRWSCRPRTTMARRMRSRSLTSIRRLACSALPTRARAALARARARAPERRHSDGRDNSVLPGRGGPGSRRGWLLPRGCAERGVDRLAARHRRHVVRVRRVRVLLLLPAVAELTRDVAPRALQGPAA